MRYFCNTNSISGSKWSEELTMSQLNIVYRQICNLLWFTPKVTGSIPVNQVFLILIYSQKLKVLYIYFAILVYQTQPRKLTY